MTATDSPHRVAFDLALLCDRLDALHARDAARRVIVGLVGEPGAGKSTLGC